MDQDTLSLAGSGDWSVPAQVSYDLFHLSGSVELPEISFYRQNVYPLFSPKPQTIERLPDQVLPVSREEAAWLLGMEEIESEKTAVGWQRRFDRLLTSVRRKGTVELL